MLISVPPSWSRLTCRAQLPWASSRGGPRLRRASRSAGTETQGLPCRCHGRLRETRRPSPQATRHRRTPERWLPSCLWAPTAPKAPWQHGRSHTYAGKGAAIARPRHSRTCPRATPPARTAYMYPKDAWVSSHSRFAWPQIHASPCKDARAAPARA